MTMATARVNFPVKVVDVQIGWPKAYGVFVGIAGMRILQATFITEPEAWRYILQKGIRAIAWVERI